MVSDWWKSRKQKDAGLLPRIIDSIFGDMKEREKDGFQFQSKVSYLEIYNEELRDLLLDDNGRPGSRSGKMYAHGGTQHQHQNLSMPREGAKECGSGPGRQGYKVKELRLPDEDSGGQGVRRGVGRGRERRNENVFNRIISV